MPNHKERVYKEINVDIWQPEVTYSCLKSGASQNETENKLWSELMPVFADNNKTLQLNSAISIFYICAFDIKCLEKGLSVFVYEILYELPGFGVADV